MNTTAKFPQDFVVVSDCLQGEVQYKLLDSDGNRLYSIVGGNNVFGDGVSTFEVYSDEAREVVLRYATASEINQYLESISLTL